MLIQYNVVITLYIMAPVSRYTHYVQSALAEILLKIKINGIDKYCVRMKYDLHYMILIMILIGIYIYQGNPVEWYLEIHRWVLKKDIDLLSLTSYVRM